MVYRVSSPASCGEFIQGTREGAPFLITCPINRFSLAVSGTERAPAGFLYELPPKSEQVRRLVLADSGTGLDKAVYLRQGVPAGKGMASSTADLSAVAVATALACGRVLTMQEIARFLLNIEPSDATFYSGVVQFDHLQGKFCRRLGPVPAMTLLIYDLGGEVDTIRFNARPELSRLRAGQEPVIARAVALFLRSMKAQDRAGIGAAATMSAFANEAILPKQGLALFHRIGQCFSSYGTVIAHSGTVMALLFSAGFKACSSYAACRREIERELPFLSYLDTVDTTNEGLQYCIETGP